MANTAVIDYKTIIAGLLTPGGWVLDGGCLGFNFAADMRARSMRVLAIDASHEISAPRWPAMTYANYAIVGVERKTIGWVKADDPQEARIVASTIEPARPTASASLGFASLGFASLGFTSPDI